jgi:hypothetical protein
MSLQRGVAHGGPTAAIVGILSIVGTVSGVLSMVVTWRLVDPGHPDLDQVRVTVRGQ